MFRFIAALILACFVTALPVAAQEAAPEAPRAETGGATTLEDIMARQRGEKVDDE